MNKKQNHIQFNLTACKKVCVSTESNVQWSPYVLFSLTYQFHYRTLINHYQVNYTETEGGGRCVWVWVYIIICYVNVISAWSEFNRPLGVPGGERSSMRILDCMCWSSTSKELLALLLPHRKMEGITLCTVLWSWRRRRPNIITITTLTFTCLTIFWWGVFDMF